MDLAFHRVEPSEQVITVRIHHQQLDVAAQNRQGCAQVMHHSRHEPSESLEAAGLERQLLKGVPFTFVLMFTNCRLHHVEHNVVIERFFYVGESPVFDGLHRRLQLAVSREDNHLDVRPDALRLAQKVYAALFGHPQIGDHEANGLLLEQIERFCHIGRKMDGIVLLEKHPEGLAGAVFVVHDEDVRYCACRFTGVLEIFAKSEFSGFGENLDCHAFKLLNLLLRSAVVSNVCAICGKTHKLFVMNDL